MPRPIETAKLTYRKDFTDTLAIFRFELENGVPDYEPGQFITIGVPDVDKPEKMVWRAYSIASPPSQKDYLELYIRMPLSPVPGKLTSALWSMSVGAELQHRGVTGPFTMEETWPDGRPDRRRLLLVGGGTGVAPYIAYAMELKRRNAPREAVILHGASYRNELGYDQLLRGLEEETAAAGEDSFRLRYIPTISRPKDEANTGWTGEVGRAEALIVPAEGAERSRIEEIVGEAITPENTFCHVCGYDGTVKACQSVLEPRGFLGFRQRRDDGSFDIKVESYG